MTEYNNKSSSPQPPSGLSRVLYRLPIMAYKLGLGGLLGGRFLLLNHVGRNSGLPRQTVLEVVDYDESSNTYFIVSGWGEKSDWYRNLRQIPEVDIQVGQRKMVVTAVPCTPEESGAAMVDYAHRNPRAARSLMSLIGYESDGSDEAYRRIGRDDLRFVALKPTGDT